MDGIRFSIKLTVKHIEAKNQRICLSALGRQQSLTLQNCTAAFSAKLAFLLS